MDYYSIIPGSGFLGVKVIPSDARPEFSFTGMVGEVVLIPSHTVVDYQVGDWVLFPPEAEKGRVRIYTPVDKSYTLVQTCQILGKVTCVPTI